MQDPLNLRIAAKSETLADQIYDFTAGFPDFERFGLAAQMRRAAVSVGSNIFEGCGRRSDRALLSFLYIAHGSATELMFQLRLATRRRYGDQSQSTAIAVELETARRMLASLIRRLEHRNTTMNTR